MSKPYLLFIFIFQIACTFLEESTSNPYDKPNNPDDAPIANGCTGAIYTDWKKSDYVLPYPVGKSYRVNLAACDGSYHSQGLPDQFAIDFDMPIGTLISASKAGIVVDIEESGKDGQHPNNLILIDHGDNSFAYYMHLTENGAIVSIGDTVKQGDQLGYSGNTGLAGYPHLHFVIVQDDYHWPYRSSPVNFKNTISNIRGLVKGYAYKAKSY